MDRIHERVSLLLVSVIFFSSFCGIKALQDHNKVISVLNNISAADVSEFLKSEIENYPNQTLRSSDGFDNQKCLQQFLWIFASIGKGEMWALKMLDSWGKLQAGILTGNLMSLGNFDECVETNHVTKIPNLDTIGGQYCSVVVPIVNPTSLPLQVDVNVPTPRVILLEAKTLGLSFGICVPKTCNPVFIKYLMDKFSESIGLATNPGIDQARLCTPIEAKPYEPIDIFAIIFFSTIAAFVVASTIYDYMTIKRNDRKPIFLAFSFYTNGIKLFKTHKQDQNSDMIGCLNGLRVISIVWVVLCHHFMFYFSFPTLNVTAVPELLEKLWSMIIFSATVAVDTFFFLSGFLIARSVLKELDKSKKLNVGYMYLHRYLRLTPSLAILILFQVSLIRYIGDGPLWELGTEAGVQMCQKGWWPVLLYIQNYYGGDSKGCIGHAWYLAVDMQLYILSPLIIYPLWRWRNKFLPVITGIMLISLSSVLTYFLVDDLRVSMLSPNTGDKMKLTYLPTHTRINAWLVGVLLSYLLHNIKGRVTIPKPYVFLGWILSLGVICAIIFGFYPLTQVDNQGPVWVDAIYEAFSRPVWALCLSWIVFACMNGYGGVINEFLSWTFWQPLARLTYSIYLIHLVLQTVLQSTTRTSQYFSFTQAIYAFWGDFGLTVTIAIIWCLAFESPIIILEKLLFRRGSSRSKVKTVLPVNGKNESSNF